MAATRSAEEEAREHTMRLVAQAEEATRRELGDAPVGPPAPPPAPPPRPTAGCGAGTTPTFQSVTGTWLCEIDCTYQASGRRLYAPPGDDLSNASAALAHDAIAAATEVLVRSVLSRSPTTAILLYDGHCCVSLACSI